MQKRPLGAIAMSHHVLSEYEQRSTAESCRENSEQTNQRSCGESRYALKLGLRAVLLLPWRQPVSTLSIGTQPRCNVTLLFAIRYDRSKISKAALDH